MALFISSSSSHLHFLYAMWLFGCVTQGETERRGCSWGTSPMSARSLEVTITFRRERAQPQCEVPPGRTPSAFALRLLCSLPRCRSADLSTKSWVTRDEAREPGNSETILFAVQGKYSLEPLCGALKLFIRLEECE